MNLIIYAAYGSMKNKNQVFQSKKCGCYSCLKEFEPAEINNYTDEGETVLCPFCEMDTVLPDNDPSNPITIELLGKIKSYWF